VNPRAREGLAVPVSYNTPATYTLYAFITDRVKVESETLGNNILKMKMFSNFRI